MAVLLIWYMHAELYMIENCLDRLRVKYLLMITLYYYNEMTKGTYTADGFDFKHSCHNAKIRKISEITGWYK